MLPKTIYGLATSTTPGLMSAADKAKLDSNVVTTSLLGANNGIAQLDAGGKVPASQLPAYVDDVLEYNSASAFPATGESDKIYIAKDTNVTYRWGGSAYVPIGSDLALGETSSTAYRGDYGAAAYAHGVTNKGSAFTSGLYKITTNSEGHVTAATAVVKADITGLGIPAQDTTYESLAAADGGTDVSLVTTGEKYVWNNSYLPLSGGTMTATLNIKPAGGEGGELHLHAASNDTTHNGISLDNYYGSFRVFGIPSADGTSYTGTGTPLIINPYTKTITGGYTITGTLNGNANTATQLASAGTTAQFYRGDNSWSNTLAGHLNLNGDLIFTHAASNVNGFITWASGTWYQRISIKDDSTADTAVFTFQQSSDTGSTYTDLLEIRDNGHLVLSANTGGIYKYYGSASTAPFLQVNSNNLDVSILKIDGQDPTTVRDSQAFGFNLKYIGTGGSAGNTLRLIADNSGGTDVTAMEWSGDGKVGIGTTYNNSYRLYVNGGAYFNNLITLYRESSTTDNSPAGIVFSTKDTTVSKAYTNAYIYAYHDHSSTNGANMVIHPGGNLFVGSGESAANLYPTYKASTEENLYITSDGIFYAYANAQTIANRIGFAISTGGHIVPQKAEAANNNVQSIGASGNVWANGYFTNLRATNVIVGEHVTLQYNSTDAALDFIFS